MTMTYVVKVPKVIGQLIGRNDNSWYGRNGRNDSGYGIIHILSHDFGIQWPACGYSGLG
jgi:hypothetical protein